MLTIQPAGCHHGCDRSTTVRVLLYQLRDPDVPYFDHNERERERDCVLYFQTPLVVTLFDRGVAKLINHSIFSFRPKKFICKVTGKNRHSIECTICKMDFHWGGWDDVKLLPSTGTKMSMLFLICLVCLTLQVHRKVLKKEKKNFQYDKKTNDFVHSLWSRVRWSWLQP